MIRTLKDLYTFFDTIIQHCESLSFNKEQSPYESIMDFVGNEITYGNVGRLHLAIPYTGQASLFLHFLIILTHITDLHSILNSKMEITFHNSFMLISDGEPDFNPVSVLNQIYL